MKSGVSQPTAADKFQLQDCWTLISCTRQAQNGRRLSSFLCGFGCIGMLTIVVCDFYTDSAYWAGLGILATFERPLLQCTTRGVGKVGGGALPPPAAETIASPGQFCNPFPLLQRDW